MPAMLILAFLLAAAVPLGALSAEQAVKAEKVVLYLYWGEGCPHCEKEQKFLRELKRRYPKLVIRDYEVWKHPRNGAMFQQVMKAAGARSVGVPATIVGDRLFFGFNEKVAKAVSEHVAACFRAPCPDTDAVVEGLLHPKAARPGQEAPAPAALQQSGDPDKKLDLPLLGNADPETVSLPLLTVVLGGLDSFNPCAFFVLLFLLSLLVHARSRARMLFIGGMFVLFSGVIYFLFMAAWLNIFLLVGQVALITTVAGLVALAVSGINIKEFFFFKQGVSLMIPESAKPGLFARMRGLVRAPSLAAMASGTIVLAITANAYELLCTAGFPMVYTRVLTLHKLTPTMYYLYLALYNIVYVVPLALIVGVVTVTLGSRKLTEWQGRQLKLLSGVMMLLLGIVLLTDPALLNNALAAAVLLVAAVGLSTATILITKKLRPEIAGG